MFSGQKPLSQRQSKSTISHLSGAISQQDDDDAIDSLLTTSSVSPPMQTIPSAISSSSQAAREEAAKVRMQKLPTHSMMSVSPHITKAITDITLSYEKIDKGHVVRPANVQGETAIEKANRLCELFNQRAKQSGLSAFGDIASNVRGETLNPGEVFIGHCNNVPEMRLYQPDARFVKARYFTPGYTTGKLIRFKQDAAFYGLHGTHVLNVPAGQYALAIGNQNEYQIFGEGTHVIDDSTFKFDPTKGFIPRNQSYIAHGNIHIVRVARGTIVSIRLNGQPYLLSHNTEPYFFIDPSFELVNTHPLNDAYIKHDTLQIIRVPAGKVLKLFIQNRPVLLESRAEPYVFDDATVTLGGKTFNESLEDATKNLILFSSLKRFMVKTGEQAIVYNYGNLTIIGSNESGEPILIDDPNVEVAGFVDTTLQTIHIPAKAKESKQAFITVSAKNSVEFDIQVVVGYRITNLEKAVTKLRNSATIQDHIFNRASALIIREVRKSHPDEFLKTISAQASHEQSTQQTFLELLHDELAEYGLEVLQFSIEHCQLKNTKLAEQISEGALTSAQTNTKVAILEQEGKISATQATQKAKADQIAQDRSNQARIQAAQADLEAAKLRAEALRIEADARAHATTSELMAIGRAVSEYPNLLPLLVAKEMAAALKGATLNLTSEQYPQFMLGSLAKHPATLFSSSVTSANSPAPVESAPLKLTPQ